MIANAGGDERHACVDGLMVVECRFKEVAGVCQMRDRCAAWFDAIRAQLLASKSKQLQRWDTVAAEEAMQGRRARVSRFSRIAQQQSAAAPREDKGSAEASWTAPDNDDVEHATAELQASGHRWRRNAEGGNERFGF